MLEVEKDGKATTVPNSAYDAWLIWDQQVLTYLVGGVSLEIQSQAVGMEHAAQVWSLINFMFSSRSGANVTHLRAALSNTKKINMTADQYVDKMKGFATEPSPLAAPSTMMSFATTSSTASTKSTTRCLHRLVQRPTAR
jgi:hypothetical protein